MENGYTNPMQHLIPLQYEPILERALAEDIGSGDITANVCIPADHQTRATVLAKAPGVLAGVAVSCRAFSMVDNAVVWEPHVADGDVITDRQPLATITGSARALLTAERVALNVLQRMSGTATMTARFVAEVAGTRARIVDTRKTTPGLRILEKYAVRCGGGFNHRFGLYDCVLIKDNHIAAGGGIRETVARARQETGHTLKIEVETKSLDEVREALEAKADIILLDNMPLEMLAEGVALVGDRATTEASGGVNLSTVGAIARTGVHLISVGALTHSAPALDISLEFDGSL